MSERKKVGITIDYVLRSPDFVAAFLNLKKIMIEDLYEADMGENLDSVSYWNKISKEPKKKSFYEKVSLPKSENEVGFDYTFKKYFYDEKDRMKFFEDYSFNLYGKSDPTSKKIIEFVNIIQSQLCDVYLFDRLHNSRKVISTFGWLGKSGLQVKGVEFISPNDNIKDLTKDFLDLYDPYQNDNKFLTINDDDNQPFLDFAFQLEKKINPSVIQ